MGYPKVKPTKEFYLKYRDKKAKVKGRVVVVLVHRTESRGGSWARGFRFYNSEWALLKCRLKPRGYYIPTRFSMNHGKTWHPTIKEATKSKGKLRLSTSSHGEFAFDAIQATVRKYEGPGYRWRR